MVPENIFKDRGQTGIQTRHSVEAGSKPEEKKEWTHPVAVSGPTGFSHTEPCHFSLWRSGFLGLGV